MFSKELKADFSKMAKLFESIENAIADESIEPNKKNELEYALLTEKYQATIEEALKLLLDTGAIKIHVNIEELTEDYRDFTKACFYPTSHYSLIYIRDFCDGVEKVFDNKPSLL